MNKNGSVLKRILKIFIVLIIIVGAIILIFHRKNNSSKPKTTNTEQESTTKYTPLGKALKKLQSVDNGHIDVSYSKSTHTLTFTVINGEYLKQIKNQVVPVQSKWFEKQIHHNVTVKLLITNKAKRQAIQILYDQSKAKQQKNKSRQNAKNKQKQKIIQQTLKRNQKIAQIRAKQNKNRNRNKRKVVRKPKNNRKNNKRRRNVKKHQNRRRGKRNRRR